MVSAVVLVEENLLTAVASVTVTLLHSFPAIRLPQVVIVFETNHVI